MPFFRSLALIALALIALGVPGRRRPQHHHARPRLADMRLGLAGQPEPGRADVADRGINEAEDRARRPVGAPQPELAQLARLPAARQRPGVPGHAGHLPAHLVARALTLVGPALRG